MEELKYILVFGLLHASTYLAFSLGFSLILGVAKIPNLAYGALYVLSGYVAYELLASLGLPFYIAAGLAITLTGIASLLIGEVAVRPALKNPVGVFITTMSVAYILEEYFKMGMGLRPVTLPMLSGTVSVADIPVSNQWLLVASVSLAMTLALVLFLRKTSMGMAIRAVAESWEESLRFSINPLRVLRVTLLITGLYAGMTGVLLSPLKALTPSAGWTPLFAAFAVVILGGVGSIVGTAIASVIYGLVEQTVTFTLGSGLARVVPLFLIVAVLLLRPHGIMGRGE